MAEKANKAVENHKSFYSCSAAVLCAFADEAGLDEQEAKLLNLRFGLEGGLPKTPQQAGEALGLTEEEVLKIETEALLKLRQQG